MKGEMEEIIEQQVALDSKPEQSEEETALRGDEA